MLSLNEMVAEDEGGADVFELQDVIANDHENPATIAARKMDWEFFIASLTSREKLIAEFLLVGQNLSQLARKLKLDRATILQCKKRLAVKVLDYMGADILAEIMRMPG